MNRIIRFRVWDKINEEWLIRRKINLNTGQNSELYVYSAKGDTFNETTLEWAIENEEGFSVMQSTGLRDRNNVEIFEGDIIKWGIDYKKGEVRWNQMRPKFFIKTKDRYYNNYELGNYITNEVIGNIYENPELLK